MKGKPDYYWRKSKEEGYPARSVFKLQEIQEKHHPIARGSRILDLGASPGSWSLWLMDMLAGAGGVTGVDLNLPDRKLLTRKGYRFFQGDFTDPVLIAKIREAGPYDAVVSDAAPQTTGNRTRDTARSAELVRQALAICGSCLCPGGSCVVKIFQGGEERDILADMKTLFATVRAFKPKASRSDSMETYFIGLGFTTPAAPC
ncbi:MAG TPA: RlmE family RNA methyltransferase [Spirochaetia bacterium]